MDCHDVLREIKRRLTSIHRDYMTMSLDLKRNYRISHELTEKSELIDHSLSGEIRRIDDYLGQVMEKQVAHSH
jgi:hypothetical protein